MQVTNTKHFAPKGSIFELSMSKDGEILIIHVQEKVKHQYEL